MSGFIKVADERRSLPILGWRCRWKLEASFWSGLFVIGWEATPLPSFFVTDTPPFAGWITLGLAGFAMITAIQVKLRLHRKIAAEKAARAISAPNPLSLIELLREHGVREFGSMYLYMPMPKRSRHNAAWAWIDTLRSEGLIKGEPWHIKAEHVKESVRESHDSLFDDDTAHFDVYRLDWQALQEIMGDELL